MKRSLIFFLVFVIIGLSYSGESPLPKIEKGNYDIEYRKIPTFFVDFVYQITIQGTSKDYHAWLNIILYNDKGKEIESFGTQIIIKPKKLQVFDGRRMITIGIAKKIEEVGFDLGIIKKKY